MIIGIGTDIIEIARVKQAVDARGERFLSRVFTPEEVAFCRNRKNPYPGLAVRFAAKEAVLKALGCGLRGVNWLQAAVVREDGPPEVVLTGQAARIAAELGVKRVLISLSHSDSHAVAYAIAIGGEQDVYCQR